MCGLAQTKTRMMTQGQAIAGDVESPPAQ